MQHTIEQKYGTDIWDQITQHSTLPTSAELAHGCRNIPNYYSAAVELHGVRPADANYIEERLMCKNGYQ